MKPHTTIDQNYVVYKHFVDFQVNVYIPQRDWIPDIKVALATEPVDADAIVQYFMDNAESRKVGGK